MVVYLFITIMPVYSYIIAFYANIMFLTSHVTRPVKIRLETQNTMIITKPLFSTKIQYFHSVPCTVNDKSFMVRKLSQFSLADF